MNLPKPPVLPATHSQSARSPLEARMVKSAASSASRRVTPATPQLGQQLVEQPNGFYPEESRLLHEALALAKMRWFDGEFVILGKSDRMEVQIRRGASELQRWAVLAIPLYDMNAPGAVEICLHFLSEAHLMAHVLDFQYQVAINMKTEQLEFLLTLPLKQITAAQVGELIGSFVNSLADSLEQELGELLQQFGAENEASSG